MLVKNTSFIFHRQISIISFNQLRTNEIIIVTVKCGVKQDIFSLEQVFAKHQLEEKFARQKSYEPVHFYSCVGA